MQKSRRFKYSGFKVFINRLTNEHRHRITLFPISGGYGTGYTQENMNIVETEAKIKNQIDRKIWDSYLKQRGDK